MRFGLFLDTSSQQGSQPSKAKGKYRAALIAGLAAIITLATLWVIVGSAIYPLYWFEFIFKHGFLHWRLSAYGLDYLIENVPSLLWIPATATIIVCFVVWRWKLRHSRERTGCAHEKGATCPAANQAFLPRNPETHQAPG
jgi:hypothetical protein